MATAKECAAKCKAQATEDSRIYDEGRAAYNLCKKSYSLIDNPYKDAQGWSCRQWQYGYQDAYTLEHPPEPREESYGPFYNMRNEGYENKYFPGGRD